jgi:hypothetical protein
MKEKARRDEIWRLNNATKRALEEGRELSRKLCLTV